MKYTLDQAKRNAMPNFLDKPPFDHDDRAYEGNEDRISSDPYGRSPYEKDKDRVLYSSAFRRLAGVTQTSAVNERRVLHNRLTHSLKVAQIGRRIASRLESQLGEVKAAELGLCADVIEAAALAHDLGHPPFGHIAEQTLNKLPPHPKSAVGFEGNAQSFRIVTKLAVRRTSLGLDLTRATLNGILKYPRLGPTAPDPERMLWTDRSRGKKWGAYDSEKEDFKFARQNSDTNVRSVNAMVMDWADDIGFATHDLDDYVRAGLIPLNQYQMTADSRDIASHAVERHPASQYPGFNSDEFGKAYDRVLKKAPGKPFSGMRQDRFELHNFISSCIKSAAYAVQMRESPPWVDIASDAQYEIEVLKELTWFYVIESPALAVIQEGQRRLIEDLYRMLTCWVSDAAVGFRGAGFRMPAALEAIIEAANLDNGTKALSADARTHRIVCDYICTLTEDQALDMYERLTGTYRGSLFGAWF